MSLADLSIRKPTFITCIVILMLAVGALCMRKLGVDLFPDVTFPVITVTTSYPGAGPSEVETLVSKPLEDEISTLGGLKRITSINSEGMSQVVAEFTMSTDIKYAEQQIRDRVGSSKRKLPTEIKEPIIRRIDPSDQPIVILSLDAQVPDTQLFDLADQVIRPKLEQVQNVGLVEIVGGRKREIQVLLDREKLKSSKISASTVVNRIAAAGENIPGGKTDQGNQSTILRTLGEFKSLKDIENTVINFFGNDVPILVRKIGKVTDSIEDETSRAFINGKKALFLHVYRQSGANTIAVVEAIKKQLIQVNRELESFEGKPQITVVRDGSIWIDANVQDVKESITMGVILAVLVVFFFLANARSTVITGLALPNSLIGAFILITLAGFTINIMTLLALSLSVGLLIDDAIVVRENIFRHLEMGKSPINAAREGTEEVRLAVIATTAAVLAVFGPVGFLKGVTGQFFKQFGLTICFAMLISLFDALTIAPMLSAYFAGKTTEKKSMNKILKSFDDFQTSLENQYEKFIRFTLKRPILVLFSSFMIFLGSCSLVRFVPKTFLPPQDAGEFSLSLDLPPGTNLDGMYQVAAQVDRLLRTNPEVAVSALSVGKNGKTEVADFYVNLISAKKRKMNTSEFKEKIRQQLKPFAYANPQVKDYDAVGGGQRPFILNIIGLDPIALEQIGSRVFEKIKAHPGLKDVDTSYRAGKPELQIVLQPAQAEALGISSKILGHEIRTQIEGTVAAKFRELGREYDIRVRLQEDQRHLKESFSETYIPNLNQNLIRLNDVAKSVLTKGPSTINRQDRGRLITLSADIAPGAGIGNVMSDITKMFETEIKLPYGMRYQFTGQAENFEELGSSMMTAMALGVLFIYLVLASLYESFVTPFTIMIALPLAVCGSFVALFLTHESLNIFSMIGIIMLMGIASKNSILLVDYAQQLIERGVDRSTALIQAGKTRLRPVLMTTMALIAGTIPVALGLNEASRQRTSMGVSIIGGLISSTLLTLVVIPAAFSYIDRFKLWSREKLRKVFC